MTFVDICVNLDNKQFAEDADRVIQRASEAGVSILVLTGTDLSSSQNNVTRCQQQTPDGPGLFCTAGIHPHDAAGVDNDWLQELEQLAASPWVKAIGETGLDFNRNYSPRERQEDVFSGQVQLATKLGMPLFVHDRDSDGRVLELLQQFATTEVVIHCFTGNAQDLNGYIDAGYYVGITGWVADKRRGQPLRDIVHLIPDERLLIETDAPFLLPHTAPDHVVRSLTGNPKHKRRNEPALISYVATALAEARGQTMAHVAQCSARNATRLFGVESAI